jgi:glycosyltransferase involved in cell wall biosynthesis
MKLVYLASGNSIHTQRWVNYFVDRDYEVHLITDAPYNYKSLKVHVLKKYFGNRVLNLLMWSTRIKKIVKEINPDILHSHYVTSYGSLGARAAFHPFVITVWGSDILVEPRKFPILKQLIKFVLKRADLITCDGEHVKGPLTSLGADPGTIHIVFFGTDVNRFSPEKRDVKLQERLGMADCPTIISTRKLEPVYDIPSLIQAVPPVLQEFPSAKLIIAGDGSQKEVLKDLAASLGVASSVIFVGDIPNAELPSYMASADVYVSTSTSDAGLAAGTAEAMSCGLPVIVTDFGDNRGWVEDGVNGFVIPTHDPASLFDKIVYLLKNRETGRTFGMKSRKIIEERNNYHKQMDKVDNLYQALVKGYKK